MVLGRASQPVRAVLEVPQIPAPTCLGTSCARKSFAALDYSVAA